jgi:hypothetical protein
MIAGFTALGSHVENYRSDLITTGLIGGLYFTAPEAGALIPGFRRAKQSALSEG